jgi:hypothetical protein
VRRILARVGHVLLQILAVWVLAAICLQAIYVVLWFIGTILSLPGEHFADKLLGNTIVRMIYFAVVGGVPALVITFGVGYLARNWFTPLGVCFGWLLFAYGFSLSPAVGLLNATLLASWGIVAMVCGMRFGRQRGWWCIALPAALTALVVVIWR